MVTTMMARRMMRKMEKARAIWIVARRKIPRTSLASALYARRAIGPHSKVLWMPLAKQSGRWRRLSQARHDLNLDPAGRDQTLLSSMCDAITRTRRTLRHPKMVWRSLLSRVRHSALSAAIGILW